MSLTRGDLATAVPALKESAKPLVLDGGTGARPWPAEEVEVASWLGADSPRATAPELLRRDLTTEWLQGWSRRPDYEHVRCRALRFGGGRLRRPGQDGARERVSTLALEAVDRAEANAACCLRAACRTFRRRFPSPRYPSANRRRTRRVSRACRSCSWRSRSTCWLLEMIEDTRARRAPLPCCSAETGSAAVGRRQLEARRAGGLSPYDFPQRASGRPSWIRSPSWGAGSRQCHAHAGRRRGGGASCPGRARVKRTVKCVVGRLPRESRASRPEDLVQVHGGVVVQPNESLRLVGGCCGSSVRTRPGAP